MKEEVIGEGGLTSLKATTYGMPHEKRKAIIDKYKKDQLKKGKQPVKAPIQKEEVKDKKGLDKYDRHKRMIRHKQDKYGRNVIGADYNLENERKAKGWKSKLNKEETTMKDNNLYGNAYAGSKMPNVSPKDRGAIKKRAKNLFKRDLKGCLLYTSPSPRDS